MNLSGTAYELPGVKELVLARRAGIVAVAAACGALVAAPALADVSVTPKTSLQGAGDNFTFHVTNDGTAPIQTVTVTIPEDTPVAEVYPLSVDDWAPKITTRKLNTQLPSLHDDIPTDQVTGSIQWIAMPGKALAVGRTADLTIALGPLPTLSAMQFTVSTTYGNGKAGPPMSTASVTLTQPTAAQEAQIHAGHDTGSATAGDDTSGDVDSQTAAENAQFAKVVSDATRGPSFWAIAGPVVAVVALLIGGMLMWRSRHRAEEEDEPEDEVTATAEPESPEPPATETETEDEKVPVDAGGSKWSFKG